MSGVRTLRGAVTHPIKDLLSNFFQPSEYIKEKVKFWFRPLFLAPATLPFKSREGI